AAAHVAANQAEAQMHPRIAEGDAFRADALFTLRFRDFDLSEMSATGGHGVLSFFACDGWPWCWRLAFERGAVPGAEVGGSFISALRKIEQRVARRGAAANVVIVQKEFMQRGMIESRLRLHFLL